MTDRITAIIVALMLAVVGAWICFALFTMLS